MHMTSNLDNKILQTVVVDHARSFVDNVSYVFTLEDCQPPHKMNCHFFLYWVFKLAGYDLPMIFPDQINSGRLLRENEPTKPCDIMLAKAKWGGISREDSNLTHVGHVGLITDTRTLIHSQIGKGVVEELIEPLRRDPDFYLGVIRVID